MGNTQRALLGILGLVLTAGAAVGLLAGNEQHPALPIVLRVGLILLVIWLAWPQLTGGAWKFSLLVASLAIGLIVLTAARPRLLPVILAVIVIAAILNLAFRQVIKFLGESRKN